MCPFFSIFEEIFPLAPIKNILFDFGGVLYQINVKTATDNFRKLGIETRPWQHGQDEIFDLIETGELGKNDIIRLFRNFSTRIPKPTDNEILFAFNSILTGLYPETMAHLKLLSEKYNLYMLSNTNDIHFRKFSKEIKANPASADFYTFFIKEYYSYQLGLRKPDPSIFEYILDDAGLKASETLFVDDSKENILAAGRLDFQVFTFHGTNPWNDLISKFKL